MLSVLGMQLLAADCRVERDETVGKGCVPVEVDSTSTV